MKSLADAAIKLQLDEETGIRGLAVTGDPAVFTALPRGSRAADAVFARLERALDGRDFRMRCRFSPTRADESDWTATVAKPIIAAPRDAARSHRTLRQATHGSLPGRFRTHRRHSRGARPRRRGTSARARSTASTFSWRSSSASRGSRDRVRLQQMRVAARLARQEHRAADERRQRAELRAAYEAEKRVADTLQERSRSGRCRCSRRCALARATCRRPKTRGSAATGTTRWPSRRIASSSRSAT